jgi:DNA uptake protein ComE-like DNA-binding protein
MALLSWKEYKQLGREEIEETSDPLSKLNSASVEVLCEIKGIGPKTAQKIIESAPYNDLDDLARTGLNKTLSGRIKEWAG